MPILSFLIWLPILSAGAIFVAGGHHHPARARVMALVATLLSLGLCVPLYTGFDTSHYAMQFQEVVNWLPQFGIQYALGVDGFSMPMILLSTFTTLIVIIAAWRSIEKHVAQYMAVFLLMQGFMVGVFAAMDSILFYVFWEATLIPMFLIIGIWGSDNRRYAAIKFFLFTFIGSVLMLVGLLYMGSKAGSFAITDLYKLKMGLTAQTLIFIGFFLAFAIKVPMWPVHTWLPDAHTEAPAGGSVILAALMLKMGGYGFIRFSLPITPDASHHLAWFMIALSLVAVVYIALVALVQRDMKRLIAYSSIAHMGFVTLGCFLVYLIVSHTGKVADAALAMEGAMVVMVSHAFISGAMFLGVGFMYDRMHTRLIKDFGGIVQTMPVFASFFVLFAMANAGLPGTSGFVGEFMVILGSIKGSFWIAAVAATTLIFAAAYTLWMVKRVIFGEVVNDQVKTLKDIRGSELLAFTLLALLVLGIGIYPKPLVNVFHASVDHILQLSQISKLKSSSLRGRAQRGRGNPDIDAGLPRFARNDGRKST